MSIRNIEYHSMIVKNFLNCLVKKLIKLETFDEFINVSVFGEISATISRFPWFVNKQESVLF